MTDAACIAFLQWALPRMGLRWPGFRKVRTQVRNRLNRRMKAPGLDSADAYRAKGKTVQDVLREILDEAPDVEPDPEDRLPDGQT